MLKKLLEEQYGISVEEYMKFDTFEAVRGNGNYYLVANANNRAAEDINEIEKIAQHLRNFGDQHVPAFLPSKDGRFVTDLEQGQYSVMTLKPSERQQHQKRLGRKLAKFHERGRAVPFKTERISRIGQWKQIWEKRLEQMENVWNKLLFQTPEDEFERMFIESFPYYIGLTENAIQYLVDTELDEEPVETDSGTVCHERFLNSTWGSSYYIKNPFDWVFDHRSRDLAEWTRERYFRNTQTYEQETKLFFMEYQSISPLSAFSWRLLFSRLLFPLHYFECIENYYITQSEQQKRQLEEQLVKILKQSTEYERFLSRFYHTAGAPLKPLNIPQLDWLLVK